MNYIANAMKKTIFICILIVFLVSSCASKKEELTINPDAKSYLYSTTVETERPELDDYTKELISNYQKNPTEENKEILRAQIAVSYDEVVEKKKAKLEELRETAKEQSKIDEMEVIVDEMLRDREERIDQALSRFMDPRLKPGARETEDGYLPVLGADLNVSISYTAVSNKEYREYLIAMGRSTEGYEEDDLPAVNVSYYDAVAYCEWLTSNDSDFLYRLPTEEEWERAAGHMPKDADFNSQEDLGLTSVYDYADTLSASGAINMWGTVWEWTSTPREDGTIAVKGGSWDSDRTDCRTENRDFGKNPKHGYKNTGFRIIREG